LLFEMPPPSLKIERAYFDKSQERRHHARNIHTQAY
jgi:hypothetical protein